MDYFVVVMNEDKDHFDESADSSFEVDTVTETKLKRPTMYKVLLLNDDYTPMEFVVAVLERVFSFPNERAVKLMLAIHTKGSGVAGVFGYEIAETKANQVMNLAREHGHPLQCTVVED